MYPISIFMTYLYDLTTVGPPPGFKLHIPAKDSLHRKRIAMEGIY